MNKQLNKIVLSIGLIALMSAAASAQVMIGGIPNPAHPDLKAWFDADDAASFTFSGGNQVATWTDRSSNGVVGTSAGTSVTRTLTGPNGTYTVNFAGIRADVLALSSTINLSMGANGDASAFVVAKNTVNNGTLMSGNGNIQFFRRNGSNMVFFKGTNPDPNVSGDTLGADRIRYAEWFGGPGPGNNTGNVNYDLNGAPLAVNNPQNIGLQDWNLTTLGGRPGGVGCCGEFNGDIAEILLYDRALSDEEQNSVGAYLAAKYDIQTTYVNPIPEPSTFVLAAMALAGLGFVRRRRRSRA